MLSAGSSYERTDDPGDPTRGVVGRVEARHASKLTGSDVALQFTRLSLDGSTYVRIAEEAVLAFRVRLGDVDVAVLAEPFDDTGLNVLPLYDEDFLVAVPPQHPWAKRSSIASIDLKQETMLLLGVGHCFRDQVLEVCPEAARFSANSEGIQKTVEGSSLETIRHMVAEGLGVTVLPKMSATEVDPLLTFIPFDAPAPSRRVVLVWRKSFSRDRAIAALREVILSVDLPGCTKL